MLYVDAAMTGNTVPNEDFRSGLSLEDPSRGSTIYLCVRQWLTTTASLAAVSLRVSCEIYLTTIESFGIDNTTIRNAAFQVRRESRKLAHNS